MIYRNLPEIPIPPEGRINHDVKRQVSVYHNTDGRRSRTVIGQATSEYSMHPTDKFKKLFPDLWSKYYGKKGMRPAALKAGLYAITLAIGEQCGVYEIVQGSFGPEDGNGVMDYCMYNIRFRSSSAQLFEEDMEDHMIFSRNMWSDDKYSKFFNDKKNETKINNFRMRWIDRCVQRNINNVWLCVDGSNNDCAVKDSDLAELGHAKSLRDTEVVGYMWAVNAEDGRPVTWFTNPGGVPDCKAVKEVIEFLGKSEMTVKGLIMDRGFATQEIFDLAEACKMEAIVMLKSNANATQELMTRFAEKIRWSMDYIVDPEPIFGVVDSVKIFSQSKKLSPVGLFFSGMSHACRAKDLIKKILKAQKEVSRQIQKTPANVSIPANMNRFLQLEKDADGCCIDVTLKSEACQKAINTKGFYAIASTGKTERSAKEIHDLYALRDVSEKQYSILKSQLNGAVTRSHSDQGVSTRLAVSFIASIIRTEIELACKTRELDSNKWIRKLDKAYFRDINNVYFTVIQEEQKLDKLLSQFGITKKHFDKICEDVNSSNPLRSLTRKMPVITEAEAEAKVQKGRGRTKGSKNKKTLEREAKEQALRAAGLWVEKPKRGRGRPPGSKNKKTLEREKTAAEARAKVFTPEAPAAKKKGPGRPKGSKNKKTLEREAGHAEHQTRLEKKSRNKKSAGGATEPTVPNVLTPTSKNG